MPEAEMNAASLAALSGSLRLNILLRHPLRLRVSDVMAAVAEDFPGIDWEDLSASEHEIDTARPGVAASIGNATPGAALVGFSCEPGAVVADWDRLFFHNRFQWDDARRVLSAHRSFLRLQIGASNSPPTLAQRFENARRILCIAAVFAKLDVCLGVHWVPGGVLMRPADCITAANVAMTGEFPFFQWIGLKVSGEEGDVSVATEGASAFLGREVALPNVDLPPADAVQWVYAATMMQLTCGHEFADGNTMSLETGDEPTLRIRLDRPSDGVERWVLFHPKSLADHEARFGAPANRPAPEGFDNRIWSREGALRDELYSFVAGGGA